MRLDSPHGPLIPAAFGVAAFGVLVTLTGPRDVWAVCLRGLLHGLRILAALVA